ncbi:hypothetical protein C3L33_18336, partial [Rhododendron williamsianum]
MDQFLKPGSLSKTLLFLFLLFSTNLLTFFISTTLYSPCSSTHHLLPPTPMLKKTMFNKGSCPDDELLAQKLLLRGCEPLPRRRCHPAAPPEYAEPYPLPASLWTSPPDSSVVWTSYTCKNYTCLIHRKKNKGFDDCKDCFDLEGREKTRWAQPGTGSGPDFSIDDVLAVKSPGTIRIGLDIGGGVATFAARWVVLADHFFCVGDQLEEVYAPIINSIGFEKVKWEVGAKLDRGPELREMYLSALLEKPLKNSW